MRRRITRPLTLYIKRSRYWELGYPERNRIRGGYRVLSVPVRNLAERAINSVADAYREGLRY